MRLCAHCTGSLVAGLNAFLHLETGSMALINSSFSPTTSSAVLVLSSSHITGGILTVEI